MKAWLTRTAALAVGVVLVLHARPAVGQVDVEVGEVEVVEPGGDPIEGGGSATPFSLRFPSGAECPGDSANDNYRVNSYMVPNSVDPLDITYDGLGPTPSQYGPGKEFRQPLFNADSTFFASIQTENADAPGQPGKILEIPQLDLDVFVPGDVPAGRYNIGIACTLFNEIERVWNTQIEVTEDPADEPAGIRWSVVGFEPSDDSSPPYLAIGGGAVAVLALALVLLPRRQATG